jgi:hypothetical protein
VFQPPAEDNRGPDEARSSPDAWEQAAKADLVPSLPRIPFAGPMPGRAQYPDRSTRLRKPPIALSIISLLALGCARTTVQTLSRTVVTQAAEGTAGDASGFVAAVPAFEGEGRCQTIPVSGGEQLRVLQMDGPGGARRSVSLRFDGAGTLLSYSDVRGDLRVNGDGPKTAITLGFDNGSGTAMNERAPAAAATQGIVISRPEAMLDLANLGTPRRMIETVKARCGG